jgi:hypothetical protein
VLGLLLVEQEVTMWFGEPLLPFEQVATGVGPELTIEQVVKI